MQARDIATVCTVPDGGLTQLLTMIEAERSMRLVTLSIEQEGIGIATGCWLGGKRAMIAMQSSGVGNCINALGLPAAYRAPCLMLVTNASGSSGAGVIRCGARPACCIIAAIIGPFESWTK